MPQSKKQRLTTLDAVTPAPVTVFHVSPSSPSSIGRIHPTLSESNAPTNAVSAVSRRPQLTPSEKLAVLNWHHINGRNQKATAAHFRALSRYEKLNQGTISRWLAAEAKIREAVSSGSTQSKSATKDVLYSCRRNAATREKSLRHPELEKCLTLWLEQLDAMQRSRLSGREIKSTARQIYDELEVPESDRLELSNGWLSRFQTRHGLKLHRRHCDTLASSDEVDVEAERSRIRDDITMFLAGNEGGGDGEASRSLDDVWSIEMSTVYLECSPIKDVDGACKSRKRTGIAVGLAANATGTEHFEPIFIEHDDTDQRALNFKHYFSTDMERKTSSIFYDWLHARNQTLIDANRHVLLLITKPCGNVTDEVRCSNIHLRFLSPPLAADAQPCSIGLTKAFQSLYRKLLVNWAVNKLHSSKDEVAHGSELFELSNTDAIGLAKEAWQLVGANPKLAASCWQKAQVLSTDTASALVEADAYISVAINEEIVNLEQALQVLSLEAQSCHVPMARISADDFIRLDLDEAQSSGLSIKELVHRVVPQRQLKHTIPAADIPSPLQQENSPTEHNQSPSEENNSTDVDPPEPRPIQQEPAISPDVVLQAQLTLEQYWKQSNVYLSPAVRQVLKQTRAQLQQHQLRTQGTKGTVAGENPDIAIGG